MRYMVTDQVLAPQHYSINSSSSNHTCFSLFQVNLATKMVLHSFADSVGSLLTSWYACFYIYRSAGGICPTKSSLSTVWTNWSQHLKRLRIVTLAVYYLKTGSQSMGRFMERRASRVCSPIQSRSVDASKSYMHTQNRMHQTPAKRYKLILVQ